MSRRERNQTNPGGNHLERLADDEHRPFAVDISELARVAGEDQKRKDEDGADD